MTLPETSCYNQGSVKSSLLSNESLSSQKIGVNAIAQSLVPKVQFNLQLSSKEKSDRAKVLLPCEHQETGKSIQIYDGRKSLNTYVQKRPLNFIHLTCHGEDNSRLLDQLFLLADLGQFKYGSMGMKDELRLNWLQWKRRLLKHHPTYW
nr:elongator complex protein 5 [Tanacetum cinerariifolium]